MHTLLYNELKPDEIPELNKIIRFLENNDFHAAQVKKVDHNLYRARLNKADRLLFALYNNGQNTYALILEHIKNHAYEKSRFLRRGVKINEDLIPDIIDIDQEVISDLPFLQGQKGFFHWLREPITFDNKQQEIYQLTLPVIIVGTAGSGKTLLLLEKMKQMEGDVLYVTHSPFLASHARSLYGSNDYHKLDQRISFLSYQDFLDSIAIPTSTPITADLFKEWFSKHINATSIKEPHALFEEIRGVITGSSIHSAYLSKDEYLALGVKESIFPAEQREDAYELFLRYLNYLKTHHYYDHNITSYEYLSAQRKKYDCIVVDEVQDITPIQLHLIMACLRQANHFMLCGDANQIVYPNFFSWAKLKKLFFQNQTNDITGITQVLNTNYRNSASIIQLTNKLLHIKNARFGSIDRETHQEMQTSSSEQGELLILQAKPEILHEINLKTRNSKDFAVIVLYDDLKEQASTFFKTPLIFSATECKGLEYDNVILYDMVSCAFTQYEAIAKGVEASEVGGVMPYSRNKDKTDKSLEKLKFFINALFVAATRAKVNLFWLESEPQHPLLNLLNADEIEYSTDKISHHQSSKEEWQLEASKLESQGKDEQARHIRDNILHQASPSWEVIAGSAIQGLFDSALVKNDRKARLLLFEYALVYEDHEARNALLSVGYKPAYHPEDGMKQLIKKHFMMYQLEQLDAIQRQIGKYGVNFRNPFNLTPLMIGAWLGSAEVIQLANKFKADLDLANNKGLTAYQIAIERACLHDDYASQKLEQVLPQLQPESMQIRYENKQLQLNSDQPLFFLLQLMLALFYRIMPDNMLLDGGFNAEHLVKALRNWPENVAPTGFDHIDSVHNLLTEISAGTVEGDREQTPLLIPLNNGHFLFNPQVMIKVEGEWFHIYDVFLLDELSTGHYDDNLLGFEANPLYAQMLKLKIIEYKQSLGLIEMTNTPQGNSDQVQ